ncbi:MAG TPA: hypothetical protein V6D23_10775, partial [Candidatus Obscuribacterales bacterium]
VSQMNKKMSDYSQALDEAFKTLCPNGSEKEAKDFAKLMGVSDQDFDKVFSQADGKYSCNTEKLMDVIDDQTFASDTDAAQKGYGAGGESGLKGLITTLMFDPQFSADAVAKMDPKPTLNVIMDEPEQGLEYLELAKKLAAARGVNVRLVVVPTNVAATELQDNPDKVIGTINLNDLSISPDRTTATYTMSMLGQPSVTTTIPLYESETNAPLPAGEKPETFRDLCLPFLFKQDDGETKPLQKRQSMVN